jgi:hypothetical protein
MTGDDFRKLALAFPETREAAHMGHPDFRVAGKIFATLGHPGPSWGVVKLTPQQQDALTRRASGVFTPVKGFWGQRGATMVNLEAATVAVVRQALRAAWCNTAPRRLVRAAGAGDPLISAARTRTRRPPAARSRTPRTR